ncbi:unnamed protein product [Plutella xylostella]|uniref:(diamondback moth) hypothetical protein n=1 Tax=Plutella xylostella TaxID=51655 RepID=A0A8S4FEX9_PLUXY|nr:unnamed protein product [Plutella xylostella]
MTCCQTSKFYFEYKIDEVRIISFARIIVKNVDGVLCNLIIFNMFLVKVFIPALFLLLAIPKYCNSQDVEPTRYSFNHPPLNEDTEYVRSVIGDSIQDETEKQLEIKQSESSSQYVPIVKLTTGSDVEEVSKIQTLAGKPKKYRKIVRNKKLVRSNLQIPVAVIYDNPDDIPSTIGNIPPQSKGAILKNELEVEIASTTTTSFSETTTQGNLKDNGATESEPELTLSTEATPKPKRVKVQRRRKVVKKPIVAEQDSVTVTERTSNDNRRRRPINKETNDSERIVQRNPVRSDNVRSLKEQTTTPRIQSSTRSTVRRVTTAAPQVTESERNVQKNQFTSRSGNVRTLQEQTTATPSIIQSSTRPTSRQTITAVPPTSQSTSTIRNTVRQSTLASPTTVTSDVKRKTDNGSERLFFQSRIQGDDQNTKRTRSKDPVVPIVESRNIVYSHSGDFHYSYLSGDGTRAFEDSANEKNSEVVGGFSYKDKDGQDISLTYEAGVDGYRPVGAHLPTPPPIPPAIARALKYLATKSTPAYDTATESL